VPELTLEGQTLSYELHGDGDPVVILSNLVTDARFWPGPFIGKLTNAAYQVVPLQHQGPADTMERIVADFAAAIEHLDLAPAHLWGFSQGGMFAQELALARPDIVRSAVLMATVGRKFAYMRFIVDDFVPKMQALREREPEAAHAGMTLMTMLSFPPNILANDTLIGGILQLAKDMDPSSLDENAMKRSMGVTTAYEDRVAALAGIGVPCLVLSFAQDMNALAAGCREVAAAIPEARYVEIEGAAHAGIGTHTDEVVGHVLKFFADI
jgi:pimeloyl-ACP methyl ester carboxylesterase